MSPKPTEWSTQIGRLDWLLEHLHEIRVTFDATFDPATNKPAASFLSLNYDPCDRKWDTRSDSRKRIMSAIDTLIALEKGEPHDNDHQTEG